MIFSPAPDPIIGEIQITQKPIIEFLQSRDDSQIDFNHDPGQMRYE
jgi:hypothetical protein